MHTITYLPQGVDLFAGSVGQNIARFQPNPDSGAILAAATMAGMDALIRSMSSGFDTDVGLRGNKLSAGQRQRVALARALFGKAHVHFTAFDTRTTPEVIGRVDTLGSDVEMDEKTGVSFYRARLTLDGMKIPESVKKKLVAGMPVEVQIETGSRNAVSYFLKPLTDQLNRTFREN